MLAGTQLSTCFYRPLDANCLMAFLKIS